MKRLVITAILTLCFSWIATIFAANEVVNLQQPTINGDFSLDKALHERRSVRNFTSQELSPKQISQLLWAADGISDDRNKFRTAPSAWATYPLNLYLVKNDGVWQYDALTHSIKKINDENKHKQLQKACMGQKQISKAPSVIVITMQNDKLSSKMGIENAKRFAYLEAGHIAQNILLEAVALGLAGVPMTGFVDQDVRAALNIPDGQETIYVVPVGYKK